MLFELDLTFIYMLVKFYLDSLISKPDESLPYADWVALKFKLTLLNKLVKPVVVISERCSESARKLYPVDVVILSIIFTFFISFRSNNEVIALNDGTHMNCATTMSNATDE